MNGGAGEQQVCICWLIWYKCHSTAGQYVSNTCMSHLDNYFMASCILTLNLSLENGDVAKFIKHALTLSIHQGTAVAEAVCCWPLITQAQV